MKQVDFQKLLEGNLIGRTEKALKANIDDILNQFTEAAEQDREGFFYSLFHSTRYDAMEALVDQKIANEFELYNIALKCKMDDLRMGVDTDSIQNRVHKAALDQLDEEKIPEFYSSLVDQLLSDKESKTLLPSTETLQELYEGLFVVGHGQALRKLHNFLGYYRGHEGRNSEELIAAVRAEDRDKALKLISQRHYVYDFSGFDGFNDQKVLEFFFLNSLRHPNYNIAAKDKNSNTPLHMATINNHTETTKALLEAAKGNPKLLEILCKPNKYGNTPLHVATINNHTETTKALLEAAKGNPKLLEILCKPNNNGKTPLHVAARNGQTSIARALLEAAKENPKLLEMLCKPNKYGNTPLDLAKNQEIKQIIQEAINKANERTRAMQATSYSTSAASSSINELATTAMPAPQSSAQVNSSAAELQQTSRGNAQNPSDHSRS